MTTRPRRLLAAFGLTALVAGALAAPSLAADHGSGARFHVTASYSTTTGFGDPTCPPVGIRVSGAGTASGTHIGGGGQWQSSECIDPVSRPGFAVVAGDATITATNGDQLFVHYDAVAQAPDPTTGEFHPVATFTFTGGTGHFTGATGGGVVLADGNAFAQTETAHLDGVVVLGRGD